MVIVRIFPSIGRLVLFCTLSAISFSTSIAAPLFLDLSGHETDPQPRLVLTGQKAEFVLTLTATTALEPLLGLDLFAAGGPLLAPLAKDVHPELHRQGDAKAGVQRFEFEFAIPAAEKELSLVLRLRVRADAQQEWQPMPPVQLTAVPSTWKQWLQTFARKIPAGRLAGSERLDRLFSAAEIETPETNSDESAADQAVRVWFADFGEGRHRLPSTGPSVLWVIFKDNPGADFQVTRLGPDQPACLLVDSRALAADSDAASQELFQRALASARALVTSETSTTLP